MYITVFSSLVLLLSLNLDSDSSRSHLSSPQFENSHFYVKVFSLCSFYFSPGFAYRKSFWYSTKNRLFLQSWGVSAASGFD